MHRQDNGKVCRLEESTVELIIGEAISWLLKHGHYILIAGAVIFVIGVVVVIAWALPIADQLQRDAVVLQSEQVNPRESESLLLEVTDLSRPLSIVVNSDNPDAQLQAILQRPDGQQAINSTFSENTVLNTDPVTAGTYKLTLTNIGQSGTSINVLFGHLPGVEENNQLAFEAYSGALAGLGLIITGIIVMIIGGVIIVVTRRRAQA